ncbi:MAG: MFS transporter, partial [Spirochaetia bacterium]|nr:MFS transporter [Spirochaetia bacterium]
EAGIIAGLFGLMNLFARALGGFFSDKVNRSFGLQGRVLVLALFLAGEAVGLIFFSKSTTLWVAVALMITFAFFLKMANGGTYAVVPFVNKRAVGLVSGIVGAGGNVGAMLFGFMFKGSLPWPTVLFILGIVIACIAALTPLIRFGKEENAGSFAVAPTPIHPKPSLGT